MLEVITLSYNFNLPIGLIVGSREVNGIVEAIDDEDHIKLAGGWYKFQDISEVVS